MKTILLKVWGEKIGQVSLKDFIKGAIMAGLAVIVAFVYQYISKGEFPPMDAATWKIEEQAAIGAIVTYVLKNFMTNSQDQFLKAEPKSDAPIK